VIQNPAHRQAARDRVLRHKYAAQIAANTHLVENQARKLQRLHAQIKSEVIALACFDYEEHYVVDFEEYCSMDEQLRDTEGSGKVLGPCLKNVVKVADNMAILPLGTRLSVCLSRSALDSVLA
jgi:hypothetical protein